MEKTLTKRNYIREGWLHVFRDANGKEVYVPCTKEEYERMGGVDGAKHNPTLEEHTWTHSLGGTLVVDSETGMLGENEYVEFNDMYFICLKSEAVSQDREEVRVPKGDINEITKKLWQ